MKAGETFELFGCKWIVTEVYKNYNHELWHVERFRATVIEAPKGYDGIREIDAAVR